MRRKEDRAAATHDRERVGLATVGAVRERDECTCAHLAAPAGCVFALLVVPGAARLPLRAGFCTGARHRGGRDDDPHVRCDETIARGPRAISNVLRAALVTAGVFGFIRPHLICRRQAYRGCQIQGGEREHGVEAAHSLRAAGEGRRAGGAGF